MDFGKRKKRRPLVQSREGRNDRRAIQLDRYMEKVEDTDKTVAHFVIEFAQFLKYSQLVALVALFFQSSVS